MLYYLDEESKAKMILSISNMVYAVILFLVSTIVVGKSVLIIAGTLLIVVPPPVIMLFIHDHLCVEWTKRHKKITRQQMIAMYGTSMLFNGTGVLLVIFSLIHIYMYL